MKTALVENLDDLGRLEISGSYTLWNNCNVPKYD